MKQRFFDEIDDGWEDLISDVYNKDIVTIKPKGNNDVLTDEDIKNCPNIKNAQHIIIDEGTTVIDENALNSYYNKNILDNVKSIKFPTSLKIIKHFACMYLPNLHTIEFNGNIESIGDYAFNNCKNLKNIKFNGKIKYIGNNVFNKCNITGELVFPKGLQSIGSSAFYQNKNITKVVFPEGLQMFGYWAFGGCAGITGDVIIPESAIFSESIFSACDNIKRIFISKKIKHDYNPDYIIGNDAEVIYY